MLSRQVTCAVRIIYELHRSKPDKQGRCSLKRATIHRVCDMDRMVVRRTLQGLCNHNCISLVGTNAVLSVSPDELTLYDLCLILHKGTPLGEETEMMSDIEQQFDTMPTLMKVNTKLDAVGKKLLSRTTVGQLIASKETIKHYT